MPTLRQGRRNGCKYETNSAFGKRRIPYTSSDVLEKAKEEPKKTLDPHEDEKLSGDMRELYDRLEPSQESTARRRQFVDKLQKILETEWPGNEFKVHVFGSSGNMLYTSDSDGKAH
jgi:DNA polymerase sigma